MRASSRLGRTIVHVTRPATRSLSPLPNPLIPPGTPQVAQEQNAQNADWGAARGRSFEVCNFRLRMPSERHLWTIPRFVPPGSWLRTS